MPEISAQLMAGVTVASGGLCVLSLIVASWAVKRLPSDYLVRDLAPASQRPAARLLRIARNVVGVVLAVAGLMMLVLPGQGLLTLLAAVSMMDFPGKRRFERRLLSTPRVLDVLNRWRRRTGHPPLISPRASRDACDTRH